MLEVGDIVMFKPESFIGDVICKVTKSEYSHVAIALSDTLLLNSNRFIKSNVVELDYNEEIHHIYRPIGITDIQKEKLLHEAYKYIDVRYDYIQIIGLFLRIVFNWNTTLLNNLNKFICSEIIDKVYYESGVARLDNKYMYNITPQELLEKYNFYKIV